MIFKNDDIWVLLEKKKKNSNKVSTIICTLPRAKNPTLVEKQESKSEIWKEMGDDREEEDSE